MNLLNHRITGGGSNYCCPFCNNPKLSVLVQGCMDDGDVARREEEEQRVIEATIKSRVMELNGECSSAPSSPTTTSSTPDSRWRITIVHALIVVNQAHPQQHQQVIKLGEGTEGVIWWPPTMILHRQFSYWQ